MSHPPEIIAALIQSEAAKLNATIAEMRAENADRMRDGYALAWSGEMFADARSEHEEAVAALLAQLESPSPNPDTVTISQDAARSCLAELKEVRRTFILAEFPHAVTIDRAIAELERVLEAK